MPLMLCLFFFKKMKTKALKVFFVYAITFSSFLAIALILKYVLHNLDLYLITLRLSLLAEFCFLSLFFYNVLKTSKKKVIFYISCLGFSIFSFIDYHVSAKNDFSFIPIVVECLFFLLVIIYFFYEKLKYLSSTPIYYTAAFWISCAFIIYFSGNFFLFLLSNSYYKNADFKHIYTLVYNSVTIIKNLFLCIAIGVNAQLETEETKDSFSIDIDLGTFNPFTKTTNLNIL